MERIIDNINNRYLNWDELHKIDNKIDWKSNVGFTLLFYFNGEKHSLKILEDCGYIGRSHYVKIKFDNNIVKDIRVGRLKNMDFKKVYYQYTFKYKPGDVVNGLQILEQIPKKRQNCNWVRKYYKCSCLKDGYEFEVSEYSLISRNSGCPVCANKKIIPGINDVATTNHWMVTYFKNKTEATQYSSKSGHKIICKCPTCGNEKKMQIEVLHRCGFRCDFCSDKISHPNKIMTYALLQLQNKNIIHNFQREFSASWAGNYKYDGYFEIESQKFIMEMDGGFHFVDNTLNNKKYQEAQKVDKIKQNLAESHNIIVLRVDCNYKTMVERDDYIVNNLKTVLSCYLNVSVIDWKECVSYANNNLINEICNKYNSGLSRKKICSEYPWITNSTIGNYLKIGTQCGLCNYDGRYSKNYSNFYLLNNSLRVLEKTSTAGKLLEILKNKYSINISKPTFYKHLNKEWYISNQYLLKADLIC